MNFGITNDGLYVENDGLSEGASTTTGWRYVECLKRNTNNLCVSNANAAMCPVRLTFYVLRIFISW